MARALIIQGTGSGAGKSIITAGLCRIFSNQGYKTAPFKAQNMALNSFVTSDSLEIGRAQALQAVAARATADVRMNPVLLKPAADDRSQVVVMGKALSHMAFREYMQMKDELKETVRRAYESLAAEFDIIILEGAGSPAEINLRDNDFVNMHSAFMAKAPVLIVGDIDRGGVLASLVGTMELLDSREKEQVAGFIINKFRGDRTLLEPGITFLEQKTGKHVFGVIPMLKGLNLPEEDSVPLEMHEDKSVKNTAAINIVVIALPHLSNFTDFGAFANESGTALYYTRDPESLKQADIVMIPGSKNTLEDMEFLEQSGFSSALRCAAYNGKRIIGICGGYQMLGNLIEDSEFVESGKNAVKGLGLLDMTTVFRKDKILKQTRAVCKTNGCLVEGYEIHHGVSESRERVFIEDEERQTLGSINKTGKIWGSYLHGIFDGAEFRLSFLNEVRSDKGLAPSEKVSEYDINESLDRLAGILEEALDIKSICRLMGLPGKKRGGIL